MRDKIIKTTESQRIKCQGLCVFDSDDQPLLILGPEQFPELRPSAPNLLRVDELIADRVISGTLAGKKVEGGQVFSKRDDVGVLDAEMVIAKNYVLTDGQNNLRIDGRLTVPIMRFLAGMAARYQASKQAGVEAAAGGTSVQNEDDPSTDGDQAPSESYPRRSSEPERTPEGDNSTDAEPTPP